MKLHDLAPDKGSRKRKHRVGRGHAAGQGKTAGRGTKGAGARGRNARKGARFEGGQLPLVRRLPFKRGFTNLFKIYYQEVNIGDLVELFASGATITPVELKAKGLINNSEKPVVILGDITEDGFNTRYTIHAHRFSKKAEARLIEAGGTIQKLDLKMVGARATIKLLNKERLAELEAFEARGGISRRPKTKRAHPPQPKPQWEPKAQ